MSIGGLSSTTSNSIRGYGGLSSGLDRDTLIENLTYGTTSKIEKQEQKKTQLEWQQTAIRNIAEKMMAFADKYTATLTSSTNLFNSNFWGKSKLSVYGAFSNLVKISGSSNSANDIAIQGVKQLAKKASWSTTPAAGSSFESSGKVDIDSTIKVDNLVGKNIMFGYGGKNYAIALPEGEGYCYDTVDDVAASINKALKEQQISSGETLGDIIEVSANGGKLEFKDKAGTTNELTLKGGSALEYLGFGPEKDFEEISFAGGSAVSADDIDASKLVSNVDFKEYAAGKEFTFEYNGTTATIKMPEKDQWSTLDDLKSSIQSQMDKAFGRDRVKVDTTAAGGLSFMTTDPSTGQPDATSSLTLVDGDSRLMEAMGFEAGANNRVNTTQKLSKLGITDGTVLKINGKEIEFSENDTINTLLEKINSQSDVQVSYQKASGKFIFTSKEDGASGTVDFSGSDAAFDNIFGGMSSAGEVRGQDAIIAVKYGGSDEVVELKRGTNSFTVDGLTVSVSGTFGYNGDDVDMTSEAVTFDAKVDVDKVTNSFKEMKEAYNEIIALANKESSTKPDRDYAPLTDAQKKELSEDEIKTYEEKAKQGLLFGDSDIRALTRDLRYVIGGANQEALKEIGITTSSSYSENGKLVFDEAKFRAALEADPDKVEKLITQKATKDENGNTVGVNGIAQNMKDVMYKYANNLGDYGVLIRKAGSSRAPRSITDNAIYRQIEEINKTIKKYESRLEMERDRYIKQFTSLETLISQMNSQSSYLSQFGGSF